MTAHEAKEQVHVFTYGSLMLPSIFQRVVGRCAQSVKASLTHWRRVQVAHASYPAAYPSQGSQIEGILWLGLSPDEFVRLDRFEGSDYHRVQVEVTTLTGLVYPAEIYQWARSDGLRHEPWDAAWFEEVGFRNFEKMFL